MTDENYDGGPAREASLRDLYAGFLLCGLARDLTVRTPLDHHVLTDQAPEVVAECWRVADVMLEARRGVRATPGQAARKKAGGPREGVEL